MKKKFTPLNNRKANLMGKSRCAPLDKRDLTGQSALIRRKYQRLFSVTVFALFVLLVAGVLEFGESARAQICEAPTGYDCWYVATNGNDFDDGSFETPFLTIQYAVNNMNGGDIIYLMSGTYYENVLLSNVKDGTCQPVECTLGTCSEIDCTGGSWSTITSYHGEWAKIDGQNNEKYALGRGDSGESSGAFLHYWKFERLEMTGGTNGENTGAGLSVSGGPFIVRYCYIHDNLASSAEENPGGIRGYEWQDSVIEYCFFDNNGVATGTDINSANILIFTDYEWRNNGRYGFENDGDNLYVARNKISYNYISGSVVGFKYKGAQLFTGRNPGIADYEDAYKTYGDNIHHNIFQGQRDYAINAEQDFCQVHNNIIDSIPRGITVNYQPDAQLYKVLIYNNLIINPIYHGITRYGSEYFTSFAENQNHHGRDYNNIIDNADVGYSHWFTSSGINVLPRGTSRMGYDAWDITNYYNSNNYFYRPADSRIMRFDDTFYTASEFESQTKTHIPRNVYSNNYNPSDELYQGTSGADQYKTRGEHILESTTTIADGGIGGAHPYLDGVQIPPYVGAVNPNDNDWVAGVLGLADTNILISGGSGDPDWIEGANDTTPPSRSNGQPTGTLSSGTTSTTISLDTDETAECKYDTASGVTFDQQQFTFDTTGQADHSTDITDLEDGNSYTYYVKCQDESGNANPDDFEISFNIASHQTYGISNFINLVTNWLKSESGLESDVNGDGVVNTRDLGIMMSNWQ